MFLPSLLNWYKWEIEWIDDCLNSDRRYLLFAYGVHFLFHLSNTIQSIEIMMDFSLNSLVVIYWRLLREIFCCNFYPLRLRQGYIVPVKQIIARNRSIICLPTSDKSQPQSERKRTPNEFVYLYLCLYIPLINRTCTIP